MKGRKGVKKGVRKGEEKGTSKQGERVWNLKG